MNKAHKPVSFALTPDRIDLSWPNIPGAVEYRIYRSTGRAPRNTDRDLAAITADTVYQDRELKPATTYRYAIVAIDQDGRPQRLPDTSCATLAGGLTLTTKGSTLTVRGETFEITWDRNRGGEIAQVRQYDGNDWVRVNADAPATVPGLTITDEAGADHHASETKAKPFKIEKNTPDEIVFSTSTVLGTLGVGTRYSVFKEGAMFCELSLPRHELKGDRTQGIDSEANKQLLDKISARFGLLINPELLRTKFRWGAYPRKYNKAQVWKSASDRIVDENQLMPLGSIDYGLNPDCSFTNHLEIFLEDSPYDGARSEFGSDGNAGFGFQWSFDGKAMRNLYFLPWDLGFLKTRWGLFLGASRKSRFGNVGSSRQNNLVGARVYHASGAQGVNGEMQDQWPFNVPPANLIKKQYNGFPSEKVIGQAKKDGANVMVMHQSWMRSGGSNCEPPADYIPREPKALKRFVTSCHKHGLRVALYMRGTEQFALFQPYFEKFLKRNFDGLYVDWSSPLCYGYHACTELHFSAYSYFLFTRAMRQKVGDNGILIAHSGYAPTLIAFSNFDAYLPGEFVTQKKNFLNSVDEAVYHGYLNSAGSNPICTLSEKGVAFNAGLGLSPHIWLRDFAEAPEHLMMGVWKILDSAPVDKAHVYNSLTENFRAVVPSNREFQTVVYKIDRNDLLLVTANLGEAGSSELQLNMTGLGLTGTYRVTELTASNNKLTTRDLGVTSDGIIKADNFGQYAYRGYRLKRARA